MKKIMGILMIVVGLLLGAGLFTIGATQDAPGMCVIGLGVALILVVNGCAQLGWFPSLWVKRFLFTTFGLGGLLLTSVLLADGEFESRPELSLIGFVLGLALLYWDNRRQVKP